MRTPLLAVFASALLINISALLTPTFLQAQPLGAEFYGCWRHNSAKKIGDKHVAFSVLCFRSNRTAYHATIAAEGGQDEQLEWEFIPTNSLVIDRQTCLVLPDSNNEQLFLTRCLFAGAWMRQCTRMSEDGAGCSN
jgi:hypothetical protein